MHPLLLSFLAALNRAHGLFYVACGRLRAAVSLHVYSAAPACVSARCHKQPPKSFLRSVAASPAVGGRECLKAYYASHPEKLLQVTRSSRISWSVVLVDQACLHAPPWSSQRSPPREPTSSTLHLGVEPGPHRSDRARAYEPVKGT